MPSESVEYVRAKEQREPVRGDRVRALIALDEGVADVKPGDIGIIFENRNAYGDDNGPVAAFFNAGQLNVYPEHGDVELVVAKA